MNTIRMPAFTAEASFYKSTAQYYAGPMMAGLEQRGNALVRPARKRAFCGIRGCCVDLQDLGFGITCCRRDGEGCGGPEVFDH